MTASPAPVDRNDPRQVARPRRGLLAVSIVLLLALLARPVGGVHAGGGVHEGGGIDGGLSDRAKEHAVKAAMLAKLVKYVEWPKARFPEKDAPFVVGILGSDPFGRRIDRALAGVRYQGHPVRVRRYVRPVGIQEAHVLFVPSEAAHWLELVLERVRERNVLVIGESPHFAALGGALGFYREQKNIRFEVNPNAARRAGLKIDSSLLKLARIVEERRRER
jgi:hypothetical protein